MSEGAKFVSGCYFMPVTPDTNAPDEKLQVNGKSVVFNYFRKDKEPKQEFPYDIMYNTQHEYAKSSYLNVIAPLAKKTIHGESTMVVFGGLQSLNLQNYILSQTFMQGIVSQAAGQLLHAINSHAEKLGSVTFSWYTIDCASENLVDILQTASSLQQQAGNSSKGGGDTSSANQPTLVFRDLGRGRNMVVQGLLELEITSGGDIETVIHHVSQLVPQANHKLGSGHTVMQLIINHPGKARQQHSTSFSSLKGAMETGSGSSAEENFGAGRLTFLCLGALSPTHGPHFMHKSSLANSVSTHMNDESIPEEDQKTQYPWANQLLEILSWLESRRAAPPFHRSRLLLLLREVLMRRQHSALMLLMQPTAQAHAVNKQWLQLFHAWLTYRANTTSGSAASQPSPRGGIAAAGSFTNSSASNMPVPRTGSASSLLNKTQQQPQTGRSVSRQRASSSNRLSTEGSGTPVTSAHGVRSQSSSRAASPHSVHSTQSQLSIQSQRSFSNLNTLAANQTSGTNNGNVYDYYELQQQQKEQKALALQRLNSAASSPNEPQESLLHRTLSGSNQINASNSNVLSSPPPPPPPPSVTHGQHNNASFRTPMTRQASQGALSRAPSSAGNNANAGGYVSSNVSVARSTQMPASSQHQTDDVKMGGGIAYTEDFAQSESEAALAMALEASRNESAALRIAYQYAQDKYKETQQQLDTLLQQLKEEGATLKQRDKDRFKGALRDLKDYQIYKEVMETAMLRLQNQLEVVILQNQELKAAKSHEERQIQRQRSFSEKYSKDLVATKRREADLETQLATLQKQNKQYLREKDAAIATLAQHQTASTQKIQSLQEQLALKQREVDDLTIRVKIAEEKNGTLEHDKDALLQHTTQEMSTLRAAHSKALETLMGYQEENDALRGAVYDLAGSGGHPVIDRSHSSKLTSNHTEGKSKSAGGVNIPAQQRQMNNEQTSDENRKASERVPI